MVMQGVPWAVDAPALVPVESARVLAYIAAGGEDGVAAPTALKVVPLPTPGRGVRLVEGAGFAIARGAGMASQAYGFRNAGPHDVESTDVGSQAARSDLVIARVEDSNTPGEPWQAPADPVNGPYVFPRIITGVPAGTRRIQDVPGYEGNTACTLARLDRPAGSATIEASHIVDLRELANGRRKQQRLMAKPTPNQSLTASAGAMWPDFAPTVDVPAWATHMQVVASLFGIGVTGAVTGVLAIAMGAAGPDQWRSGNLVYDEDYDGTSRRTTLGLAGGEPIATALRGTRQTIRVEGRRDAGGGAGAALRTLSGSQVVLDILFEQRVA